MTAPLTVSWIRRRSRWKGCTRWVPHRSSRRPSKWWRTPTLTPLCPGVKLAIVLSFGTPTNSPKPFFPNTSSTTISPASFASSTPMSVQFSTVLSFSSVSLNLSDLNPLFSLFLKNTAHITRHQNIIFFL